MDGDRGKDGNDAPCVEDTVMGVLQKDLQQQWAFALCCGEPVDALLHLLHILCLTIVDSVLLADTFCVGVMLRSHVFVACRTLFQPWQHVEDDTLAIVHQEYAQVASQVLVPQRILVIEETQVANHNNRRVSWRRC